MKSKLSKIPICLSACLSLSGPATLSSLASSVNLEHESDRLTITGADTTDRDLSEDDQEMLPLWHAVADRSAEIKAMVAYLNSRTDNAKVRSDLNEMLLTMSCTGWWTVCGFAGPLSYFPPERLELFGRTCSGTEYAVICRMIRIPAAELRIAFQDYKRAIVAINHVEISGGKSDKRPGPANQEQLSSLCRAVSKCRQRLVDLAGEEAVAGLDTQIGAHTFAE